MSSVLRSPIHPLLSARVSLVHGQAGRTEQQFPAPLIAHLLESPVTGGGGQKISNHTDKIDHYYLSHSLSLSLH